MKLFFIIPTVIFLFCGCSEMYSPLTPNISNFKKKYELHAEGIICTNGVNYKTAFSPLNNVCIQYNGLFRNSSGATQHYNEVAIGIYNIMSPVISNQILFGYGSGSSFYGGSSSYLEKPKGTYTSFYGQVSFNVNKNENNLSSLCMRIADVNYTIDDLISPKELIGKNYQIYYTEFFYSLQVKYDKHTFFMIYTGLNFKTEPNTTIVTSPFNFGFGLTVKLFNLKKEITN